MQINTLINQHKKKFDKFYINILNKKLDNSLLSKAMKYSSVNGGKRIRAFLVSQSSKIVNLTEEDTMILSSIITGSWEMGLAIGGVEVITKMVLYFLHERAWYNFSKFGVEKKD